jgi:hypothetical protein
MSHYTILVPAENEEELDKVMLPYYETGCSGETDAKFFEAFAREQAFPPEQRRFRYEFEPEYRAVDMEAKAREVMERYSRRDRDPHDDRFYSVAPPKFEKGDYLGVVLEYTGYELGPNGDIGYWHNPLRKWDWYQIGGRWEGLLLLRDGSTANAARAGDVDWKAMGKKREDNATDDWDNFVSWIERVVPMAEYVEMDHEGKRDVWGKIGEIERDGWAGMDKATRESNTRARFFSPGDAKTREEYIKASVGDRGLTWAFIDLNGEWMERASMGWFGMHSDEDKTYGLGFWEFVEGLAPEQNLFVLDCHI